MTAIELLKRRGPMPAVEIANALLLQPETVYTQLVRAYDAGLVRVNSVCAGDRTWREWEAMDEVTA